MKRILFLLVILVLLNHPKTYAQTERQVDLCIYGATSAGVIAAYTASKAGKSVLLIDPGSRLGGLSSGGLGMTDIGNKFVVKGLALDFYRKLGAHYDTFEQWIFEPKVAESIFKQYMDDSNAEMLPEYYLTAVEKKGSEIQKALFSNRVQGKELRVKATVFMDCSYEGDLLAQAGASFHVGRESNDTYGETLSGVQLLDGHQFPDGIDPYREKGNPNSGLLWGISDKKLEAQGTGDRKVQAYNYRITLTNVPENRIPITEPENYDPSRYELLKRQKELQPWKSLSDVFIWSLMPNGKTDINNRNGFSTDMIGMNWEYPEADYERRKEIIKAHEDYTKGLLYFVGHDPSVPQFIRDQMQEWGYPKDEYEEYGNWSPQLYIREARRLVGELVMTQHHCQGREMVEDEIGYAAYTMDSHNCDRLVVNGMVKNEGNVEVGGFPPFPISYRAIVPKREEVSNLIVPVCLSASHIAFGSIRMEPVFMVLGQSGAVAAVQAIERGVPVQDVNVDEVKTELANNPKADGRQADVLIHISDSDQVELVGHWAKGQGKGYGMSFMQTDGDNQDAKATFHTPEDLPAGRYQLYTYLPRTKKSAQEYQVNVFDGTTDDLKIINTEQVDIKGQTSSTWVGVGEYQFGQGGDAPFFEISGTGVEGTVAANAVLLVPVND
ncbi:MAG: FAD-dependent oxidoreductase [Sphingobacterium sp.]